MVNNLFHNLFCVFFLSPLYPTRPFGPLQGYPVNSFRLTTGWSKIEACAGKHGSNSVYKCFPKRSTKWAAFLARGSAAQILYIITLHNPSKIEPHFLHESGSNSVYKCFQNPPTNWAAILARGRAAQILYVNAFQNAPKIEPHSLRGKMRLKFCA